MPPAQRDTILRCADTIWHSVSESGMNQTQREDPLEEGRAQGRETEAEQEGG